jgi:CheY-like chemotaxis protein
LAITEVFATQLKLSAIASAPICPHGRARPPVETRTCSGRQNLPGRLDLRGTFAHSYGAVQRQVEMSPKILSVDDSKAVRMLLARLFRPFACESYEAANGEEGLAVAARERPDLIILDYNMPVMSGVSMLRRLREDADLRRTPVIMLTAESSAENIATVARLGVRDYITKPFNEEILLAKAARVVSLVARPPLDRRAGMPDPQPEGDGAAHGPVELQRPEQTSSPALIKAMDFMRPQSPTPTSELAAGPATPSAAPLQQASVLVVDDSRIMRLSLIRALKDLGFDNIKEAKNGRQALELVLKDSFDLMLLDMEMPEMNGMEVLLALKNNPQLGGLPVIVISGADQIENAVKCIEAGAEDYLPKPFNPTLLRARATSSIEKKRLRDVDRVRLAQLQTEKDRTEAANKLVIEKNQILEKLSSKLSKYLSPQIYQSIFRGDQKVEISSKRKKLTICFTDVAGFTETTDNLESEELTNVLNHYLTEMSVIALQHGATIDKFIGDAMLLFFGDPESKGVAEDAKACVMMAIAMQRRMRELEQEWRDRGLLRPFRIRMGITTGFCTVGNFGSRDRMDYTIIGNEVNLAARLQSATEPGSILLSYETNALVQGLVMTEEQPPITVKGFPKPISGYKLVGTYDDLVKAGRVVLEERDGLHVLVDLTKQDRTDVIEILQGILTQLKWPIGRVKKAAGAGRRRKEGGAGR